MGNRKQPFGYRVVMGEIALHPQESKLVEYIFQQYLAGATYNTLVEELREQSIPYDEGKLWNKNMNSGRQPLYGRARLSAGH